MTTTVADHLLERLSEWGVRHLFGYPGDGINGILGALRRHAERIEFIQARHEETAALMATGYAKWTGEVGVCLATSGPGAIHLLNGLYDAKLDRQPVVAIVGQQKRMSIGADYQQEVDLPVLFQDVAAPFCHLCSDPAQMRHLVDRALRIALAERTVTCIIVPNDVQEMKAVQSPPREHGAVYSGVGYAPPRSLPRPEDLRAAARVLNAGERVAILAGAGARDAADELLETAERLGCGIAKALLGRAVLPDDLPHVTGAIGLLGTEASHRMVMGCDTLFLIGTSFPYAEWLPKEGSARGVQIDIAPRMLSARYPCEALLCGDAKETLRELLPLLERKEDRAWRGRIEGWVADWWKTTEARAMQPADPINPQRVFWELSPLLPDGCVVTADSGSSANWWARDLRLRSGMKASLSGNLATMGCGIPYAIAAKFAHSERPVVACVGDGAMQMNGINALITIAKYQHRWRDRRLVVLVLNNRDLNQVTWEQRVLGGDPKTEATQEIPDLRYEELARMIGLDGYAMETEADVLPVLEQALASPRPCVVNAYVDPEVPPLPPHIRWDQAKNFMSAVAGGDPAAGRMIKQSLRGMAASLKHRR